MSDTQPEPAEVSPAERWFRLAKQDLDAAKVLLADGGSAMRIVAFLAQQAAEKALKAGLIAVGVHPPHIHGLRQLHEALANQVADLRIQADDLDALDPWVIDGRYAADLPDVGRIEASDLVDAAAGVVQQIRPLVHP
jgi:HEPN domain-containing protein